MMNTVYGVIMVLTSEFQSMPPFLLKTLLSIDVPLTKTILHPDENPLHILQLDTRGGSELSEDLLNRHQTMIVGVIQTLLENTAIRQEHDAESAAVSVTEKNASSRDAQEIRTLISELTDLVEAKSCRIVAYMTWIVARKAHETCGE